MSTFVKRYELSLYGNALCVSAVQIMIMYSTQCVAIH